MRSAIRDELEKEMMSIKQMKRKMNTSDETKSLEKPAIVSSFIESRRGSVNQKSKNVSAPATLTQVVVEAEGTGINPDNQKTNNLLEEEESSSTPRVPERADLTRGGSLSLHRLVVSQINEKDERESVGSSIELQSTTDPACGEALPNASTVMRRQHSSSEDATSGSHSNRLPLSANNAGRTNTVSAPPQYGKVSNLFEDFEKDLQQNEEKSNELIDGFVSRLREIPTSQISISHNIHDHRQLHLRIKKLYNTCTVFDDAQKQVLSLLLHDTFRRWIDSPEFSHLCDVIREQTERTEREVLSQNSESEVRRRGSAADHAVEFYE